MANSILDVSELMNDIKCLTEYCKELRCEVEELEKIKKDNTVVLLDLKDIQRITGWGRKHCLDLLNDESLPVIYIGNKKQVEASQLKKYFSKPQSYSTSKYWKNIIDNS